MCQSHATQKIEIDPCSLRFLPLVLATAVIASLTFCLKANAQENASELFETVLESPAFNFLSIAANRNSQIATVYTTERNGPDRVFQFTPSGISSDFEYSNAQRLIDIELSNWGTLITDFGGSGTALLAAPFGQRPEEFFRAATNTSRGAINDDGTIGFLARESNSHGLQDVYLTTPQQGTQLLPELNEDDLIPPALLDQSGRLSVLHLFDSPEVPADVYRYTQNQGWENLTANRLPEGIQVSGFTGVGGLRPTSPSGNFVFQGQVLRPNGGFERHEVLLWDDAEETIMSVFDNSSQVDDVFLGVLPLSVNASFSDGNDLFLTASTQPFDPPFEFEYLYRNADGTILDIESMLPDGYFLTPDAQQHSLNYDGDLWLSATNDATGLFRYFLLQDGALQSVIDDTSLSLRFPVLTNSNDLYAWLPIEGSNLGRLGRLAIAVPEPRSTTVGFAAIFGWLLTRRKSRVNGQSD